MTTGVWIYQFVERAVCLQPGGQTVIRIEYGQSNP
jgi:hypothetical protein